MKLRNVIGVVFLIFIAGAFLFTHFSSGVTQKHFENQYVSFDYPSDWTVTDNSSNKYLYVVLVGPDKEIDGSIKSGERGTLETSDSKELNFVKGMNALEKSTPNGYTVYYFNGSRDCEGTIFSGNSVYSLTFINGLNSISDPENMITGTTKNCYNTVLNSLKFK